ncbi:MAG: ABC transporter ATP-binding protein, partial [Halobacteriovoraceae bacterium]|nr:ABC transporter ATP-binding protein [Halobacteriovoraceae bacterium]
QILEKEIQERGRLFSYVPQFPEIQEGLTLNKYLELSRYPYWGENNFVDPELKEKVLSHLNLKSFLERDLTTLSGGELKKAMIAGAFYQQTPLVFLDEPFQALDPKVKSEVAHFLKSWKEEYGTTYVIVSHDFLWSFYLGDFSLFLKQGELKAFGATKSVFNPSNLTEVFEHPFSTFTDSKGAEFYLPGGEL